MDTADPPLPTTAIHAPEPSSSNMATPATTSVPEFVIDPSPVDLPRLHARMRDYASAYGISTASMSQMYHTLVTPLAQRLLALPPAALYDTLVTDAYKPRMHVMYDK